MKELFPKNLRDNENINMLKNTLVEQGIDTASANRVKKIVVETIEKTCASFSITRRIEDFETFVFLQEEFGVKTGAKKYKEYIKDRNEEFRNFYEKFPCE